MKILIIGNYGAGNIGDEMILKGLLAFLNKSLVSPQITVMSGNPEETKKNHKVYSVLKFPAGFNSVINFLISFGNETKRAIKDCDFVIMGGGNLFGGPENRANFIWGVQGLFVKFYKKTLFIMGQSIGENKSILSRYFLKKIFNYASFISLRDRESINLLNELQIQKNIFLQPDFAFCSKTIQKEKNKTIAVSLRNSKKLDTKAILSIIEFLNFQVEKNGYKIDLLNFQQGTAGEEKINKEIFNKIQKKDFIKMYNNLTDTSESLEIIARSEILIGMRLHSIISAIKTNTPFLALDYAPKIWNLLKSLGLENQFIKDKSAENLKQLFHKTVTNYKSISEKLKNLNFQFNDDFETLEKRFTRAINSN